MIAPAVALPQAFNSLDVITLALRLAFIVLIYVFLYQVARVSVRELVALGRITSMPATPPANLPNPAASLEVIDGADSSFDRGNSLPLDGYATVGRNDNNTIAIDDGFVSGSHAEIIFEDGGWWVQDLNSTNGTFLNDQPVHGRARVSDGDVLQFGRVLTRAHL